MSDVSNGTINRNRNIDDCSSLRTNQQKKILINEQSTKAHTSIKLKKQQQNPLIFQKIFTFIFHPESRTVFPLCIYSLQTYPNVTMMDDNQIFLAMISNKFSI